MITLFHAPQSRSASIVWLLEELAVPYETKLVGFRRPDGSGAKDPVNPHPHGKVPALKDGDDTIFETAAIALFLTDKYPAKKLGPLAGQAQRGEYLSWLAYRPGVMEPGIIARRFENRNRQHRGARRKIKNAFGHGKNPFRFWKHSGQGRAASRPAQCF